MSFGFSSLKVFMVVLLLGLSLSYSQSAPSSSGFCAINKSQIGIYFAGESIEQRVRYTSAPFASNGSLNLPTNNDNNQYGWVVPLVDKLSAANPGKSFVFVGSGLWQSADGFAYSGTYPSTTARNTSAVSGMSTDDWITNHRSELTSKRFCYDIAFVTRGGNDGWMDDATLTNYIIDTARLVSSGSSCNSNPTVYVVSHLPADRITIARGTARYSNTAKSAVNTLKSQNSSMDVRLIDVFGAFVNNTPTQAFPNPSWKSSNTSLNYSKIQRTGDAGHVRRLPSIYAGEIAASAVSLTTICTSPLNNSTTTPPVCSLSCTSPQLLNSTSCSCYTPVVTPPACTLSCTSPQVLNSTSCSCYTPLVCGGLTCTSPQLLNSTSCSCYSPVTIPPVNNSTTTPPTTAQSMPPLPVSGNYVGQLRTVDVSSETTLRLAINSALPGDVIRIAPGNYVFLTQLWIEAKGTSANPIYIVANGPRGSVRISTPSSEGFNVGGAAQYLVFEDLEIFNAGNNIFHIQDGSHHITLRNLNLHHAGFDGDVIKVNQANNILIEGSDLSYPGSRSSGENPAQEVIDFVDSDNSVVRLNFIHHFGNIGLYAKGGSVNALFENNVVALQSSSAVEPALGVGGWTDSNLLNGAQYEISGMIVKNNFIYGNSFGGVGIYDAFNSVLYKNILMNNDRAILQFRAGNAPLATSSNFNFSSNYVLDNRGSLPSVCQVSSHGLTGFVASSNNYWNNLNSIPTSADCNGFIASAESGATVSNINIASIDLTSYSSAIRLVNYTYSIPVSTPPLNNSTTTPPACTLSCTSPQVLNSTSCSCYTPLVCGGLTCTSPQLLNSTICSCYTPVTTPPANNSTTLPPVSSSGLSYDIGSVTTTALFISPTGSDSGDGATRSAPVSFGRAWQIVRSNPGNGWSLEFLPGVYGGTPYMDFDGAASSRPSAQRPIIFKPADSFGSAIIRGTNMEFDGVNYLYVIGLRVEHSGTDLIHVQNANHILLRNVSLIGSYAGSHENLKINQAQYVYLEDNEFFGAEQNTIDFVAVQFGHIVRNKIHYAQDWCIYTKGGSAHFVIEQNEIYDCGTGGYSAGEGAGFEYMVSPYLKYEASDIKFINNIIHDTDGSGIGVNGGYNILVAHNTLYKVGSRSQGLEIVFGGRTCDGNTAKCTANHNLGGWGPVTVGPNVEIPNKNVYIYNNILYNPSGFRSLWQHFAIYEPRSNPSGSNAPNPARTDDNLQIRGNFIYNGPSDLPLGIEGSASCTSTNPTCNEAQLKSENTINGAIPQLVNPSGGNFAPLSGGNVLSATVYAIPSFVSSDSTLPAGTLSNVVVRDFSGKTRSSNSPAGAIFVSGGSNPINNSNSTPPLNNSTTAPPVCSLTCTSPQLLNSTSCSCYTPVVTPPACTLSCTSPQLLNSTSCSCYTPVTIPPVNNSTTTPPTTSTLRVYVSGESIEQRNRFLSAPFTSSGTLSSSTPSDLEYGWMVPFADRLKLRSPGLAVQFVGSGRWTGADDSAYSGTYPSSTAQATSAVSGMSTDDWIAGHRSELTSRTYCYDIALITRGGNDGWMSVTDRKDYIKQVATLVAAGSSCNPNPIVYVTSHMPDQFGSGDESAAYRDAPRDAVSELAMSNVKFVDVYGAFDTNLRTTAFPSPTWKSGSSFNYASILLSGDQGHPSKLSSIYVGEVVANAIVLSGLGSTTPPLNNSTTTPPVCSLTCTSPQLLNSTSCSCYTPLVCGGLTCTSPQLLNTTSCSCYTPVTTPPANTTAGAYSSMPIVPTINSQMKTYLRTILASGASLGNRPSVFAKVGDSITESGSFLTDIGCGGTDQFGSYTSLIPTANYFMSTSLGAAPVWCGTGNSYTRASMAAVMGWTTSSVLSSTSSCAAPYNSYLRCEIQTIKPSIALVMYGTNDLQSPNNPTQFRTNLRTIVDTLVSDGVIPVLSTIPPRLDTVDGQAMGPRVATYNQIIDDVAAEKNVPLWNYWAQLQGSSMINYGVSSDGIHPSVYNGADGAVLNSTGLRYGYNQRNLGAIQVLDKLKTVVIDNGSPDP